MGLLCACQARSDLTMSHAARMQCGQNASARLQARAVRPTNKNQAQATTNILPVGAHVMDKTAPNKLLSQG